VREFESQSFKTKGRNYHFVGSVPKQIFHICVRTEDYNDGLFEFRAPIQTVNSFSIDIAFPYDLAVYSDPAFVNTAGYDSELLALMYYPFEVICLE
jgi:hypothetical protein